MAEVPEVKRVLITGARSWENAVIIDNAIRKLAGKWGTHRMVVIEGGAPGVDTLARQCAHSQGIHVLEMQALWNKLHRAAGPIRNKMMLSLEPDLVVAFHWDLDESSGTRDCVLSARKMGIPVRYVKKPMRVAMPSAQQEADRVAAKRAARPKRKKAR